MAKRLTLTTIGFMQFLAPTLQFLTGLYYGEELGMAGHKGGGPIYDEYRREPMDWYAAAAGEGQATWFTPKYTLPADGVRSTSPGVETALVKSSSSDCPGAAPIGHSLPPW